MKPVLLGDGVIEVEASVIAEGLDLTLAQLRRQMRAGRVTSLSERGTGEDAGRHRLTFFSEHRRFRVVVDERGRIVQRSAIDFGEAGLPPSLRKPGA
ncbi:DUF6522 family protein [Bradyrhizobium sp.]|uniref:DUF6522 family protein n=1 Tax=Bradyrhizobium sp. TaxID=376 RepID=UPI004037D571